MSEIRLAEIRERLEALEDQPSDSGFLLAWEVMQDHAPEDIRYLLDCVERLERLERVQEAVVDDVVRAVVRALETAAEAP